MFKKFFIYALALSLLSVISFKSNAFSAEHWQSDINTAGFYMPATGTYVTDYIYLDITICDDGYFEGEWSPYVCPGMICIALSADSQEEVKAQGKIDWNEGTGVIELEGEDGETSFTILESNANSMEWRIDGENWDLFNLYVLLEFQDVVSNAPHCDDPPPPPPPGGGGGGCFIDTLD